MNTNMERDTSPAHHPMLTLVYQTTNQKVKKKKNKPTTQKT